MGKKEKSYCLVFTNNMSSSPESCIFFFFYFSAGLRGVIRAPTPRLDLSGDLQYSSFWHISGAQNIVFENIAVFQQK